MPIDPFDTRWTDPELYALAGLSALRKHQRSLALPQTDDQLWDYVDRTWGVHIPRVQVCPHHVAPFAAFADAYFVRGGSLHIFEGSRGFSGKSYLLALLGLTLACTRGGSVNILGGSGEQSRRVHAYMERAWQHAGAPRHLLDGAPQAMRTRLADGSTIQCLMASSTSIRGGHPVALLLDECDEFSLPLFDAAMGQTLAQPGRPAVTVAASTHHYSEGVMTELKRRAAQQTGFVLRAWCYQETLAPHGWLDPAEVERKRLEVPAAMFRSEYDLQEPAPEHRAIQPAAVQAMFDPARGRYRGGQQERIEVEAPRPDALYAHGADWARVQDMTEIVTLRADTLPYCLVAYERMHRLPWPQMVACFDARILRYRGRSGHADLAMHDKTGLGDVVDGYLTQPARGMVLAGRARADLFSECVAGLERHEIVSPMIDSLYSQLYYCTVEDLYGSGHPPDGFVALALAYRAAKARHRLPHSDIAAALADLAKPSQWDIRV